jgi:C-terminal processing protease CtpA/Prc
MKSIALPVTVTLVITLFALSRQGPAQEPTASKPTEHRLEFALDRPDARFIDFGFNFVAGNGLGIDVTVPDAALRAQLDLEENCGLVITAAPEDSLGAKAGLKVHDIIIELNDQKVGETGKLSELLDATDGKSVRLRVLRQGKSLDVEATPKKPVVVNLAAENLLGRYYFNLTTAATEERYRIGVTLSGTDQALRSQLRLAEGEGLVVTDLVDGSPAAAAGVQKYDVLVVLDGKRLTTVEAINNQIQEIKDKEVELRLLRGGKELTLRIAPRKGKEPASDQQFIVWDTHNCQSCHQRGIDAAHLLMGTRLPAAHSAWTDGQRLSLFHIAPETKVPPTTEPSQGPQQQVEALKSQLAEMQKAISALEATLKSANTNKEEKREEKKE